MDTIESLKDENKRLRKIIDLYEISTKLDYMKIIKLINEIDSFKKSQTIS